MQPLFGIFDKAKSRNNISRRRKCKVLQERFKKRMRGDFMEGHLWFVLKRIGWGRGRVKGKDFWKEKHEHRHRTGMAGVMFKGQ